ncbi:MAG: HEAT repeat domain-containing protein [Phycisphaeraceae bacterium]|nr:HEAT repeat domain-containing protein [Phycisphaeraceae bacterium]
MNLRLLSLLAIAVIVLLLAPTTNAAPKGNAANPDLTKGEPIPEGYDHDWNLGATGARGWMFSERLTTLKARQIAVTKVHPGSPADGVLEVGDVILGVFGEPFANDPRTEFGKALTRAEADDGVLVLRVWRKGKTGTIRVKLPVLGAYSDTAPYNCPKSKRIFEQGCEALAKTMAEPNYRPNPIIRSFNALALLASGEEKYLPLLKREAQFTADSKPGGYVTWWYGPITIFLAEYVIQTGDTSVMPGLERLAMEAAEGQSIVGSWGHRFAEPSGILRGYGMMNAPGVPLSVGLVLAREAGVSDPKLDLAIQRSVNLVRFYVDKGSIPYGDHKPWIQNHDDNGKNGMAAVLFNLLGDKEAAEYFSRMSVATHGDERDTGHTGNFFNITWAMPGINPSGPNATGAWMQEYGGWYYDMARQWDGTFIHQGPPQSRPDKYRNWDTSGTKLLAYAMPLKKLRITGKGKQVVPTLSAQQAKGLIEDGRGWNNLDRNAYYDAFTDEQLLGRLSSWSPVVRERAAMALGRRKANVQPALLEMLKSDDLYTQYGACKAFKFVRGDNAAAVPVLLETFEADDMWLRILSADALAGIGDQAQSAIPAVLKRLAMPATEADPRNMEQRYLSFALFDRRGGLLGRSIEGVDRGLLLEAVRAGLVNEDGRARGALGSVYGKLTLQEIRPLLPAIHAAVVESAPSGIMFASQVRNEGLQILAKHNVEEGMQAGVDYLAESWDQWGSGGRTPKILNALVQYGANAQRITPQLEQIAEQMAAADAKRRERARRHDDKKVREAIEKIKNSDKKPEMIRIGLPRVGQGISR